MIRRSDRGLLAEWWWTVDRMSFFLILSLIAVGLMLAMAASPTVYGSPSAGGDFLYAGKQIAFALVAVGILVGASMLSPAQAFRFAAWLFALALFGVLLTLLFGETVRGARRWLDFGWIMVQPSEFLKPGFVILAAGILSVSERVRFSRPLISFAPIAPAVLILLAQPDVGQTFLLLALWAALLFFSGLSFKWFWGIGAAAVSALVVAYHCFSHVHRRIEQFLDPSAAGYQVSLSLKAFAHGGFFGVGPGAGTVKYRLPEAHSDYIFAVAGEEFGFLLCVVIAVLFCLLAIRTMLRASALRDPFAQLAGAGLALVIALQAFINMGVAVSLLPSKGMTLPFISYGGSSLFAVALTMGLALAMTRSRPAIGVAESNFDVMAMVRL